MDLIIVESPTKAKTLGRFLGEDYIVDSTMGHVMDLPKSKLGVDIERQFKPDYVPVVKRKDTVSRLKSDAKKAVVIYLATDPDREGEAIAYHVAELIDSKSKIKDPAKGEARQRRQKSKISRIVFHEITESAVKDALEHPREINMQLVDAQQARRVLDRLVGYKLSPLLWKKVRKGLSAGRVQSVAVRLIVDRENEINAFKAEEYWDIGCEVKTQNAELKTFAVKLIEKDGKKIKITNQDQANGVVVDLEKASYLVADVQKREVVKRPLPPFTTSTMTQSASRIHFWTAKRTMSVAQKLYEEGLITYHRTDSMHIATQAVDMARAYISKNLPNFFLPEKPRFYKTTSKVAQEAHEAIRPTDVNIKDQSSNIKNLGADAIKLYSLIWRRFTASQMTDSVYDETTINVKAESYLLQASGKVMKFEGWKRVYGKTENGELQLPEVVEGDALQLIKVNSEQKFTQPPAQYTEATLIKTLEKLGIGRPSTYAPTISTIQERIYVEKKEGKFFPTPVGTAVNGFLVDNFPYIVDYNFTARMEEDLDEIANGKEKWVSVIERFWNPFSKKLEVVAEKAKRVKISIEETGEKCPQCKEGDQVVRVGRFGKFLSCSRFPECKWVTPFVEKLNIKCPDCKEGEVVVKKTRKKKSFYGCSRYPECKWASWRKPGVGKENPEEDEAS